MTFYFQYIFISSCNVSWSQTKTHFLFHPFKPYPLIFILPLLQSCQKYSSLCLLSFLSWLTFYVHLLDLGWVIFYNTDTSFMFSECSEWESFCKASCLPLIKVEVSNIFISNQNWVVGVTLSQHPFHLSSS